MKKKLPLPANPSILAWSGAVVVAAGALGATLAYHAAEEPQAAPGSPLYQAAVQEALRGLTNLGATPAAAVQVPPLPEGLSPADYYWCDKCKTYHRREPAAAGKPGEPGQPPAVAGQPPAAAATPAAGPAVGGSIPPSPEGLSPADYYWCDKCKTYHPRNPAAGPAPQPAAPQPTPQPAPQPAPAHEGVAPAPAPAAPPLRGDR
jgi:hypothetical protein